MKHVNIFPTAVHQAMVEKSKVNLASSPCIHEMWLETAD